MIIDNEPTDQTINHGSFIYLCAKLNLQATTQGEENIFLQFLSWVLIIMDGYVPI